MKHIIICLLIMICTLAFSNNPTAPIKLNSNINDIDTTSIVYYTKLDDCIKKAMPAVQVYYYTKKYCKMYDVPETVAFNILKLESSYNGPDDFNYNPKRTSYAYAYGPYQLLLETARDMYEGKRNELTPDILLTDIELNVKLGIKYLRYLHNNIDTNWTVVCGYYNTGYKRINDYAINATMYVNNNKIN